MGLTVRSSCAAAAVLGFLFFAGCAQERTVPRLTLLDPAMTAPAIVPVASMLPVTPPAPPTAPGATSAQPDVRVMSFNCRVSTLFDLHNTWGLRKRLLLDTIENFDPDLLGTQECVASQIDYLRARLEGYDSVGVGRDDGKRGGEMCTVFFRTDKFEKLDAGHFWLSQTPAKPGSKGWGAFFPRMVTWVKLRPRDGSATFVWFNTHLDAFSSRARLNGAKLLRARMASIAGSLPTLVTGDFNADAGSPPYQTMVAAGGSAGPLVDTFRVTQAKPTKRDGTRHAFRGGRGGPRIDWILASPTAFRTIDADIDHTKSGILFPSDHFPVTAVLRPVIGGAPAPTFAQVE